MDFNSFYQIELYLDRRILGDFIFQVGERGGGAEGAGEENN